jgi:predicted NUDIX family NTP pyrophosphohydrolase
VPVFSLTVTRRMASKSFLVHPGGPYWKQKDAGAWSIPKGLLEPGEDPRAAARREFAEETGVSLQGELHALGSAEQSGGKTVHAFAVEADIDAAAVRSNLFQIEWPPKSGGTQEFPEVDAGAWFPLDLAYDKILPGQKAFLDRLTAWLAEAPGSAG